MKIETQKGAQQSSSEMDESISELTSTMIKAIQTVEYGLVELKNAARALNEIVIDGE